MFIRYGCLMTNTCINVHALVARRRKQEMLNIKETQLIDEAKKVVQFNPKARKCGGNKLSHNCNCYGMTLKYLFAVKDLTFKSVGEILGITPQAVNNLVNRTKESNLSGTIFLENLCNKLNIDYIYFNDLCEEVRKII